MLLEANGVFDVLFILKTYKDRFCPENKRLLSLWKVKLAFQWAYTLSLALLCTQSCRTGIIFYFVFLIHNSIEILQSRAYKPILVKQIPMKIVNKLNSKQNSREKIFDFKVGLFLISDRYISSCPLFKVTWHEANLQYLRSNGIYWKGILENEFGFWKPITLHQKSSLTLPFHINIKNKLTVFPLNFSGTHECVTSSRASMFAAGSADSRRN